VKCGTITVDMLRKAFQLPDHAEITITVPTGGDWSGMNITFGEDFNELRVKVEDVK
jgi:hypothetical protein